MLRQALGVSKRDWQGMSVSENKTNGKKNTDVYKAQTGRFAGKSDTRAGRRDTKHIQAIQEKKGKRKRENEGLIFRRKGIKRGGKDKPQKQTK